MILNEYDISNSKFVFTYTIGKDKQTLTIELVDDDCLKYKINNDKNSCTPVDWTDYMACFDYDDVASSLAKRFIKNSDTIIKVHMDINEGSFVSDLSLLPNGDFIKEESEYQLVLYPSNFDAYEADFLTLDESQIDDVIQLFEDENIDDLYDYCWSNLEETIEFFATNGDDYSFNYQIINENNDIVKEGDIEFLEWNSFDYQGGVPILKHITDDKPKYILVHTDVAKDPSCTFDVPKSLNVNNLHFESFEAIDYKIFPVYDLDIYGDTNIYRGALHYHGESLVGDVYDNGTVGDNAFYLFKLESNGKYKQKYCLK